MDVATVSRKHSAARRGDHDHAGGRRPLQHGLPFLGPGAIIGAAAVTVVLNADAPLLARLVTKAGPVYGSFATMAGMFALLYLVGLPAS